MELELGDGRSMGVDSDGELDGFVVGIEVGAGVGDGYWLESSRI